MLGVAFFMPKIDEVAFLRPFLAGWLHFEKRMLKIVNVFFTLIYCNNKINMI